MAEEMEITPLLKFSHQAICDEPVDGVPLSWNACYGAGDSTESWIRQQSKDLGAEPYILERLSKCTDSEVRMAVADHKNTPVEVLSLLSEDEDPDVRYALAENHNINREILVKLTGDANPFVAERAGRTLARLEPLSISDEQLSSIGSQPTLDKVAGSLQ